MGGLVIKNIALVGYPAEYFMPFARSLEEVGFNVYWITGLHADARYLAKMGTDRAHILDTTAGFDGQDGSVEQCRTELSEIERSDLPRVNDIIMMDRLLCKKPPQFAIRYLAHLRRVIDRFLTDSNITLLTSWRDTSMQLLTMLIGKKAGIPFVVATRARIPQEMYGFCPGHTTDDMVQLRTVTAEDRDWAEMFMTEFETRRIKPALKKSARSFTDVFRLLPMHGQAFLYELRRSFFDRGNDFSRYAIRNLVTMYFKRRLNLLRYKLWNPCDPLGSLPFCIYALHTQPESSIDVVGSYFSDQIGLIRFIARSLPVGMELYVKVHPTDVDGKTLGFYKQIKAIPGVRLIDFSHDSLELVSQSRLLFALTGTIAYEAALMGKPVIAFARNFFNRMPSVAYCDAPPQLPSLIEEMLKLDGSPKKRSEIVKFLSVLRASTFNGEVSRTYGVSRSGLTTSDLVTIQKAYTSIFNHYYPSS